MNRQITRLFYNFRAQNLVYSEQFPGVQTGPIDKFSMSISFGKGWGYSYKRPDVTRCPCWLEVLFRPRRWHQFELLSCSSKFILYQQKSMDLATMAISPTTLTPPPPPRSPPTPQYMRSTLDLYGLGIKTKVAMEKYLVGVSHNNSYSSSKNNDQKNMKWSNSFNGHNEHSCSRLMHTFQRTLVRLIKSLLDHSLVAK